MRVAIVVGHRQSSQGATAYDGTQEWTWCAQAAAFLGEAAMVAGHEQRVFLRPDLPGYTSAMRELTRAVNDWAPDVVLALHFNAAPASHKGQFHGTECLHWPGSEAGANVAWKVSAALSRAQGTRDRGGKGQSTSHAGAPLYVLRDTDAPAIIIEHHFGDHAGDHDRATAARNSGASARAIIAALEG